MDCRDAVQAMVGTRSGTDVALRCTQRRASCWPAAGNAGRSIESDRASLAIIYSYGDSRRATNFVRSDDAGGRAD